MAHSVQRGTVYPSAPQIPNDIREKVKEGQWWNGNRLFIYEIIASPESPTSYYVVSFSLFERFINALCKVLRKDYLDDKVREMIQATTIRFIDQAELRGLPDPCTTSAPPPATSTDAPKNPSPARTDSQVNPVPTSIPSNPALATQPPSRQERVLKYIPFNQWSLTERDQRAFHIIYQQLIDPNSELVFKSCTMPENPDFVFVKMDGSPRACFDDIESCRYKGNLPKQAFYLISSVHPIELEQFPFKPEYSFLIERATKFARFQPAHPVIDWENSSKVAQHQAALFLLRIFKFSIQSIQSISVSEEKQKLTYVVIGSGKGFSRIDEENINRLSQRILGFALKVERDKEQGHFAVAKVEDERREAKDRLYLAFPYYLVATTVEVNLSHFEYERKWAEKVNLCQPGTGENIVNWDDPESVRQVAMLFLRIYQISLVTFSSQKAVA